VNGSSANSPASWASVIVECASFKVLEIGTLLEETTDLFWKIGLFHIC